MPSVWCYNEECKYLKGNECMADMIELDEYDACGTVELVKKHWEQFIKAQEKVADINTLPLAEYDEKSRKYLIKEVSQCANP